MAIFTFYILHISYFMEFEISVVANLNHTFSALLARCNYYSVIIIEV